MLFLQVHHGIQKQLQARSDPHRTQAHPAPAGQARDALPAPAARAASRHRSSGPADALRWTPLPPPPAPPAPRRGSFWRCPSTRAGGEKAAARKVLHRQRHLLVKVQVLRHVPRAQVGNIPVPRRPGGGCCTAVRQLARQRADDASFSPRRSGRSAPSICPQWMCMDTSLSSVCPPTRHRHVLQINMTQRTRMPHTFLLLTRSYCNRNVKWEEGCVIARERPFVCRKAPSRCTVGRFWGEAASLREDPSPPRPLSRRAAGV